MGYQSAVHTPTRTCRTPCQFGASNTREWRRAGSDMSCRTWPYKDLRGMFAAAVQTNLTLKSFSTPEVC
jgi:hypothetical protein